MSISTPLGRASTRGSTTKEGFAIATGRAPFQIVSYDAYDRIRRCDMASALWFDTPPAAPGGVQTFSAEPDRRRLTGAAVKAVLRLVDAWGGSNAEGAALLGVSESTWDRMKAGRWDGVMSQDKLTRASGLIGG